MDTTMTMTLYVEHPYLEPIRRTNLVGCFSEKQIQRVAMLIRNLYQTSSPTVAAGRITSKIETLPGYGEQTEKDAKG